MFVRDYSKVDYDYLAEKRLNEMRSFRLIVNKYTMTPLLQIYYNVKEFEKSLIVFSQMLEKGLVDSNVLRIRIYLIVYPISVHDIQIEYKSRNLRIRILDFFIFCMSSTLKYSTILRKPKI